MMTTVRSRLLSLLLILALAIPLFPTAYGDDTTVTRYADATGGVPFSISVKYGATGASVSSALRSTLATDVKAKTGYTAAGTQLSGGSLPNEVTASGSCQLEITYRDGSTEVVECKYTVVSPASYQFTRPLSELSATSAENTNATTLLAYVNSQLELSGSGSGFNSAFGEATYAAPAFTWEMADKSYVSTGGVTYTFTNTYNDFTLTRTLTVRSASQSAPSVSINYDDSTIKGADDTVSYSLNKTTWTVCKEDMDIPNTWYDQTVYFYHHPTAYYEASDYTSLYIPPRAEAPKETLSLTATSYSITIENCWDYDSGEFSINGEDWYSTTNETYTFTGLKANESYTVYVRTAAIKGVHLTSDSKNTNIKTDERAEGGVTVDYSGSNNVGRITASATADPKIEDERISGAFAAEQFTRFDNIVSGYLDRYDTVTSHLNLHQYAGGKGISEYSLELPISNLRTAIREAGLTMTYYNDLMTVSFSNDAMDYYRSKSASGTLYIEISKLTEPPSGSKYSWLRNHYNEERPVYSVDIRNNSSDDTELTYSIPYSLKGNETISSLQVYAVSSSGSETRLSAVYNSANGCMEFTTDEQGYFVIVQEGSPSRAMPFTDVPINHWGYDFIVYSYNRGIFSGLSDTRFAPDNYINRAMIFTLLAKMDGYNVNSVITTSKFTDVNTDDWYSGGAHWALEEKLVSGNTFSGMGLMTRDEIAVALYDFLVRFDDYDGKTDTKPDEIFIDCGDLSGDAKTAIGYLRDLGLMQGTSPRMFSPGESVTRAQMAVILSRLDTMIPDDSK